MEVLANTMVEIVVWYLSASIQHTVHLKLSIMYQLYLNKAKKYDKEK